MVKVTQLITAAIKGRGTEPDGTSKYAISDNPVAQLEAFFDADGHDNSAVHINAESYFNALMNVITNKGLVTEEYADAMKHQAYALGYKFKPRGAVEMRLSEDLPPQIPLPPNYRCGGPEEEEEEQPSPFSPR